MQASGAASSGMEMKTPGVGAGTLDRAGLPSRQRATFSPSGYGASATGRAAASSQTTWRRSRSVSKAPPPGKGVRRTAISPGWIGSGAVVGALMWPSRSTAKVSTLEGSAALTPATSAPPPLRSQASKPTRTGETEAGRPIAVAAPAASIVVRRSAAPATSRSRPRSAPPVRTAASIGALPRSAGGEAAQGGGAPHRRGPSTTRPRSARRGGDRRRAPARAPARAEIALADRRAIQAPLRVEVNEIALADGDPFAVGRDRSPGDPRPPPRDRRRLVAPDAVAARRRSQPAALEEVAALAGPGHEPWIARRLPEERGAAPRRGSSRRARDPRAARRGDRDRQRRARATARGERATGARASPRTAPWRRGRRRPRHQRGRRGGRRGDRGRLRTRDHLPRQRHVTRNRGCRQRGARRP